MDEEGYEIPQPDPAIYPVHDYLQPISSGEYDSVREPTRDSQYEQLPAEGAPTSLPDYTTLNTTRSSPNSRYPEPPAYEPGGFSQPPASPPAPATNPSVAGPVIMVMPGQSQHQQLQPSTVTVVNPVQPSAEIRPPVVTTYLYCQSIGVGITLMIIGTFSVIFNIVSLAVTFDGQQDLLYYNSSVASHGLWGGVLCCVTGALAVAAGKTKSRCTDKNGFATLLTENYCKKYTIIAFMTMAIITSIACCVQFIIGASSAGVLSRDVTSCKRNGTVRTYNSYYRSTTTMSPKAAGDVCKKVETLYVMEILLSILGGLASILCIYGSAVGCRSTCNCCCCQDPSQTYQQPHAAAQYGMPMTVMTPQGQVMQLSYQPVMPQQQQQPVMVTPAAYVHTANNSSSTPINGYNQQLQSPKY